ncbi:MAG: glutamate--tRNA ligase [Rhodobacter sp.]|nr:glutamate--tRNA ligase [Rhodobacter sp.]
MTVTRFAPSPTGHLHVGNLRTALFNFLIARKSGGIFILRLDDTDPVRSRPEFADAIQRDLDWLGLGWDRLDRQSERLELYGNAAEELRGLKRLYEAFETPTELALRRRKLLKMGKPPVYDRSALDLSEDERDRLRTERGGQGVWRFLLEHERVEWEDGVLGQASIDASSVSDPVLIRQDGQVLYTLASAVDDVEMGITHVVRGSDHVTNTATQIQIIRTLGGAVPSFAHHSLLTGPQGEQLSKRLGTLALGDLRDSGVEPMALLSLMARLGSSDPVELRYSIEDLMEGFDITAFSASPTRFDVEDLRPLTARYLRGLSFDAVAADIDALGVPRRIARRFWGAVRENVGTRREMGEWWILFRDGAEPIVDAADRDFVAEAFALLPEFPFDTGTWSAWTAAVGERTGRKGRNLFMPLRKAISGRERGPEMADVMALLQKPPGLERRGSG